MAERTLSIVIDVEGTERGATQIRRMRSALDDLAGGGAGMDRIVRHGRELSGVFREIGGVVSGSGADGGVLRGIDDFFRRIATGARNAGDVLRNVWREASSYAGQAFGGGSIGGLLASFGQNVLGSFVGNSNRAVSSLGGLGSGALTGLVSGGPVGAAIGGLMGGIAGLFGGGSGKAKRHDADIANQGFAQLRQILDDYNHFRRDFASSTDAATRIWTQMQSQWSRSQSASSQRPFFDAIYRSMQSTEDERLRRRQMQALLPVPQFASGGLVSANSSAGTLAVVHPGEYVMSKRAVDDLGVATLNGLNRGSRGDQGMSISLEPASAQSLSEMLKRNPQALEEGLLVVLRRGGALSRALRA
jgi:hypothetical protein